MNENKCFYYLKGQDLFYFLIFLFLTILTTQATKGEMPHHNYKDGKLQMNCATGKISRSFLNCLNNTASIDKMQGIAVQIF